MALFSGGRTTYGYDIGILMLDTTFPRIRGDVGNAQTWNFPVLYKIVKGKLPQKVVLDLDMNDLKPFIDAAKELEEEGVRCITTSCGFLSLFQKEISKHLHVPIFTSALLLLPLLLQVYQTTKILVLTANSDTLTDAHLQSAGIDIHLKNKSFSVVGTQDKTMFTQFTVENWDYVDTEVCKKEILDTIDAAMSRESYGCILLECTNMPPYSDCIRNRYKVPVFDFVTMINFVHAGFSHNNFTNFL